ncbi:MAG: alpha-D-ribose 1-methylphosphonate 5-triphosphate synthase subunit PhnG [Moorella sp. (in: firmicutes)]|nr:alpha-D-ribose 1-methylphosphonate 5-triphosphate synthase subunit PhnG [Moorella sp. (in: firmicutes)]MDK2895203.1 alpha-D-ribose 1-methylphosphonate 5-triphosphate synthase subunit PhnG [Moorella sp. (in: firmicutes)]
MEYQHISYIVAAGELTALVPLAEEVLQTGEVKVVQEPATSLVMMQALETVQGYPFNLGEVLITECAVEVNGVPGKGYALGDEGERALCLALFDAALRGGHPLATRIRALLREEEEKIRQRELAEFAVVNRTRVEFEVMNP